ncbi:hypothetical protein [uncultured Stenotrophomonas sp.]|uniref:hypothetical protein n=1 Tax=uncultured Stenotrophomonas sp. TaxID=165438 RepID=UPI0025E15C4F|nr:hypothetical protein [uncultured Stenotrophomonas sp.]
MRSDPAAEPLWTRLTAGVIALAFMSGLVRLLLQLPELNVAREETRIQLRWLLTSPQAAARLPAQQAVASALQNPPLAQAVARFDLPAADVPPATPSPAVTAAPAAKPASAQTGWSQRLYGKDGSLAVPTDGNATRQKSATERVFEHRDALATGVGERPLEELVSGMFEDKTKPPTLGQIGARLIHGPDIQPAQARRPPEVAFNPSLHERKSDLGSEATGDAYKAAPIRYEKAPDMKGEASRRIRVALGALEQRYPRCNGQQRRQWLAPVMTHLDALQRAEYRFNNGADPVEAEHSLLSAADSAYDMARRALWDAERRMKMCT